MSSKYCGKIRKRSFISSKYLSIIFCTSMKSFMRGEVNKGKGRREGNKKGGDKTGEVVGKSSEMLVWKVRRIRIGS